VNHLPLGEQNREIREAGQQTSGGNQKTNQCPANRYDYPAAPRGPNAPADRSLNSVGWPKRSLAGWLTRQLGGYNNPTTWSFALVGWPSRSLTGCLTLQLSGYRCPFVGIPFTAVFLQAKLLLHLCPDCPGNLVENYRLYQVLVIRPYLCLPGKKVFSGADHVRVQENMRWVHVLADHLLRQA